MMKGSSIESFRRLLDIAYSQQGLFTAAQANAAGYSNQSIHYQVSVGNWLRIRRGFFQIVNIPPQPWPTIFAAALWARNRLGKQMAVVSHFSALVVYGMLKETPNKIHMTRLPGFKRRSDIPSDFVLHDKKLWPDEISVSGGILVTTPEKTLIDTFQSRVFNPKEAADLVRNGLWNRCITVNNIYKISNDERELFLSTFDCKRIRNALTMCGTNDL